MSKRSPDRLSRALREHGVRYVVDAGGEPVAVLLSLEEYEQYFDLLEDAADGQDEKVADRLRQAAGRPAGEGESFRDYLRERNKPGGDVQD
jgi:PHD/YefM family antitoxin component YafN of YafNO toxin-antitoxin module